MPEENETMDSLLTEYLELKRLRFEGDTGVENLSAVAKAIGYKGHGFRYGTPLEEFLSDNPGAQEALLEWIKTNNIPQWMEAIETELPEKEDEPDETGEACEQD